MTTGSTDIDKVFKALGDPCSRPLPSLKWRGATGGTRTSPTGITPYDGIVRLTVSHDELGADSGMAKGIQQGWPIVLSSLKSLLETGQGIDVFAKPTGV
jgi:hypothetical protein